MVNIEFEKELGKTYMVLKGERETPDYSIRMARENKIMNLLPIEISNIDGDLRYYYDIEGFQQLEKRYSMTCMSYDDIRKLIFAIVSLPEKLEEYLLDKDYVFLTPSTVFFDSEGEPCFVYYPGEGCSFSDGLKSICTYILKKLDHQDEKAVSAGYAAFEISTRENFALSEFDRVFKFEKDFEIQKTETTDEFSIFKDDDIDGLDFDGLDFFEEEDFEEEVEEEALPDYEDKPDKKAGLIEKIVKIAPFAIIIVVGAFLFLSSSMSGLSLPLRIASFVMISIAIALISYLLKGKFTSSKK